MSQLKKICVLGLGYIGLPTAALLANRGYDTHGVDVNQSTNPYKPKVSTLVDAPSPAGEGWDEGDITN